MSTSAALRPLAAEPTPAFILSEAQLRQHVRRSLGALLVDESGELAQGVAIYSLSDPRDLRTVCYIGQSADPRRRLLQHINAARLWLPDERPWWVRSPRLRPLYSWIRAIFHDGGRLPALLVRAWVNADTARVAERAHICACLERQLPLLNYESERLQRQLQLL